MKSQNEQTTFLFINKNSVSGSLTNSEATEKAKLLSHVQRRRRRLDALSVNSLEWVNVSDVSSMQQNGTKYRKRHESNLEKGQTKHSHSSRHAEQATLVTRAPTNNGTDPFYCTILGGKLDPHPFLKFAVSKVSTATLLAEAFAPADAIRVRYPLRHRHTFKDRLQSCISNPLAMYSTLAFSSSSLAWASGKIYLNCPPEYFLGQTLSAVSKELARPSRSDSMWLLNAIYTLAIVQLWNATPELWVNCPNRASMAPLQSLENARTHLLALIELIEQSGGVNGVNAWVLECAIITDKCLAIAARTHPILPFRWQPSSFPPSPDAVAEFYRYEELSINEGFQSVNLPTTLRLAIREITQFIKFAPVLWSKGPNEAEESWLYLRYQSLEMNLLSLLNFEGLEECIRFAVLLFLIQCTLHQSAPMMAAVIVRQLHEVFLTIPEETLLSQKRSDRLLLFWCLCTGGMTGQPLLATSWFDDALLQLCDEMDVQLEFEPFRRILTKFFFCRDKQESKLNNSLRRLRGKRNTIVKLSTTTSTTLTCKPNVDPLEYMLASNEWIYT